MAGSGDEETAITDINVTPLVDISLVLVIIFMVTAPMVVQSGIVVNSSKVTASHGKSTRNESIQAKLTKKNVYINGKKIEKEKVPGTLKGLLTKNKKKLVTITADRAVAHGDIVWFLDVAKQMGAKKLAMMKEEKKK